MKYRDENGVFQDLYLPPTGDTLPIGSEVDYDGTEVPYGWEETTDPESYSTDEVKTNKTWINNKPIYRKVFNIGTLPNATEKIYTTDLNWATHTVVKIDGCAISSSGVMLPINFSNPISAAQMIGCRTTGTNTITVYTGIDRTNLTGYVILEYTKTTD